MSFSNLTSGSGKGRVHVFWRVSEGQNCQTNGRGRRDRGKVDPREECGY